MMNVSLLSIAFQDLYCIDRVNYFLVYAWFPPPPYFFLIEMQ